MQAADAKAAEAPQPPTHYPSSAQLQRENLALRKAAQQASADVARLQAERDTACAAQERAAHIAAQLQAALRERDADAAQMATMCVPRSSASLQGIVAPLLRLAPSCVMFVRQRCAILHASSLWNPAVFKRCVAIDDAPAAIS